MPHRWRAAARPAGRAPAGSASWPRAATRLQARGWQVAQGGVRLWHWTVEAATPHRRCEPPTMQIHVRHANSPATAPTRQLHRGAHGRHAALPVGPPQVGDERQHALQLPQTWAVCSTMGWLCSSGHWPEHVLAHHKKHWQCGVAQPGLPGKHSMAPSRTCVRKGSCCRCGWVWRQQAAAACGGAAREEGSQQGSCGMSCAWPAQSASNMPVPHSSA